MALAAAEATYETCDSVEHLSGDELVRGQVRLKNGLGGDQGRDASERPGAKELSTKNRRWAILRRFSRTILGRSGSLFSGERSADDGALRAVQVQCQTSDPSRVAAPTYSNEPFLMF